MNEDELKPCPFCGKSDIHIEQKGTFFWCECYDCGASSREHHTLPGVNILQSEDFARGYWNTRPIEDALQAENEWLKEELQQEKTRSQLNLEAEERRMLNITYYCAEIDRLTARVAELEEIDKLRSESVSTLNQANANNEDEIELLEKRIAEFEEKQRWIPVSERLPQIGVRVLFYNNFTKNIHKGWYSGDEWTSDIGIFYNGDKLKRITHWMPLPESPNDTQTQTIVYGKESEE